MKTDSPKQQLAGMMSRYTPEIVKLANASLKKMRRLVPGAVEMVYDNYNALVIGFGPSERASEALFSIALYPRWINLFFLTGVELKDPKKILQGNGNIVRRVQINTAAMLDDSDIQALIQQAMDTTDVPIDTSKRGRLVIKSISAKRRPRR